MKDHVTLIGCPKLDEGDYADKLAKIIGNNSIRSISIVRMEVPCCGGIENAVIPCHGAKRKDDPMAGSDHCL